MAWWQLTIECKREELEYTEDTLLELGALSITLCDAADEPIYEPPLGETPIWPTTRVTGLFDQTSTVEELYDRLLEKLPEHLVSSIRKEQIDDQVWERAFLDRYQPIQFANNLWVCPSWIAPPDPQAVNIILDPGIAFGTGTHPTTALCLEFLGKNPPKQKSVLDFGCGSGILAISAYKMGASLVSSIDIDPQAVESTISNAKRNGIDPAKLNISLPNDQVIEPVQYLIANILSGPLIELETLFSSLTVSGAQLLLSGILPDQADNVIQAYQQHFELDPATITDNWCRITGTRK